MHKFRKDGGRRTRFAKIVVVFVAALVASEACASPAQRQSAIQPSSARVLVVGDEVECADCVLALGAAAELGRTDRRLAPTLYSGVVLTPRGNLFVAPITTPGLVASYDRTGRWMDTVRVAPPTQEVELFAAERTGALYLVVNGQLVELDPSVPGGRIIPLMNVPDQPAGIARLAGGALAMALADPTESQLGSPVLLYSRDGALIARVAGDARTQRDEPYHARRRILATSSSGGVWVGYPSANVIELYDERGVLRRRLTRRSAVFDSLSRLPIASDAAPEVAMPRLVAMVEADSGLLVTMTTFPRDDVRSASRHSLSVSETLQDHARLFDTLVEVIDTERGRVVQQSVCPGLLMVFLDPGTVAALRSSHEDQYWLETRTIEFIRAGESRRQDSGGERDELRTCARTLPR